MALRLIGMKHWLRRTKRARNESNERKVRVHYCDGMRFVCARSRYAPEAKSSGSETHKPTYALDDSLCMNQLFTSFNAPRHLKTFINLKKPILLKCLLCDGHKWISIIFHLNFIRLRVQWEFPRNYVWIS